MFKKGISYKQMRKLNDARKIQIKSLSEARHILFLFEGFDKMRFDSIQLFIENIRSKNPQVNPTILFCLNESAPKAQKGEEPVPKHTEFNLDFVYTLYKNEVGFGAKIKNEQVAGIMDSQFDMLFVVQPSFSDVFQGIMPRLNALLKIGSDSEFNQEFCDFIVKVDESYSDLDTLEMMKRYIQIVGN